MVNLSQWLTSGKGFIVVTLEDTPNIPKGTYIKVQSIQNNSISGVIEQLNITRKVIQINDPSKSPDSILKYGNRVTVDASKVSMPISLYNTMPIITLNRLPQLSTYGNRESFYLEITQDSVTFSPMLADNLLISEGSKVVFTKNIQNAIYMGIVYNSRAPYAYIVQNNYKIINTELCRTLSLLNSTNTVFPFRVLLRSLNPVHSAQYPDIEFYRLEFNSGGFENAIAALEENSSSREFLKNQLTQKLGDPEFRSLLNEILEELEEVTVSLDSNDF